MVWTVRCALLTAGLSFVLAADEPSSGSVWIPERQLLPVMELHPAYSREQKQPSLPKTPADTDRMIEVPTWRPPVAFEGGGSSKRPAISALSDPLSLSLSPPTDHTTHARPVQISHESSEDGLTASTTSPHPPVQAPADVQDGQQWPRFKVGDDKFGLHGYPLGHPGFKHLYEGPARVPWQPWNFEHFVKNGAFQTFMTRFQPEPFLLRAIQATLWNQLQHDGIRPRLVSTKGSAMQGDYLWPPVQASPNHPEQLDVPSRARSKRIRNILAESIQAHSMRNPEVFHLEVPFRSEVRHILMVPSKAYRFIEAWESAAGSQMWFFFEGMRSVYDGKNRLAFLGSMFLPDHAEWALLKARILKIGLPSLAAFNRVGT